MPESVERSGSCLCGAVRISAGEISLNVGLCHCRMCRKWGGGPYMEVSCGTGVSFEGEDSISVFTSSDWAERGFCKNCGSHLFYRLRGTGEYQVPVGLFEDEEGFKLELQVFIDEKPSYYSFSNKTHEMTGAEVFEKYAPPAE